MLTIFASLLAVASAAPGYRRQAGYGSNGGAPTAHVKNGTISGVHSSTYNEDYFLGIPYAQPPVNGLRFKVPQSLNTTWNSTYDATEYAPSCVGYGGDQKGYPISEDCLYLNVVRPSGYEDQELPIGLWIHGGGLQMGGSRDARYNLSFIVENSVKIGKPIIGVSINYRLAGWGFIASDEVSGSGDTNIGLRDQRLALHWVHENIAAFGGDPAKVTIWGESAGAASVGTCLLTTVVTMASSALVSWNLATP
jgi:carboxylesterase type B